MFRTVGLFVAAAFISGISLLSVASRAQPAKPEVGEIQVGILPISAHVPIFAAQELGYFAEGGLKVTIQFSGGGAELVPLLIQGQMQIAHVPVSAVLQARERNLDVVMIGPGTYVEKSQPPGQTATIVKADSKIERLSDLAGKKIAVPVINSVNWLYNRAQLQKAGVDPKTVTYVELPFPNMLDAVLNGYVDAASIVQPFLYFGTSTGKVRVLGYDILDVQPGAQVAGFTVSRKWALSNPRTLAVFQHAVARAVDYLTANDAEAVKIITKFTKTKPEVIAGTGLPSWSNELSAEKIEVQMRLAAQQGLLQRPQDVRQLIWSDAR